MSHVKIMKKAAQALKKDVKHYKHEETEDKKHHDKKKFQHHRTEEREAKSAAKDLQKRVKRAHE